MHRQCYNPDLRHSRHDSLDVHLPTDRTFSIFLPNRPPLLDGNVPTAFLPIYLEKNLFPVPNLRHAANNGRKALRTVRGRVHFRRDHPLRGHRANIPIYSTYN